MNRDGPEFTIWLILKSLHLLKVNERIEYKLFSLIYKVFTTAQPSYLHNLICLQPPRSTCSLSVVTNSCPPFISFRITDRSFRCASPCLGTNFLIHSVSLTSLVLIHLLIHLSTHLFHHPRCHHPSCLHSFAPGSKPTFSTNPSHLNTNFFYPSDCLRDNGTGPDLSCSSIYF